jgi:hypothetical protein
MTNLGNYFRCATKAVCIGALLALGAAAQPHADLAEQIFAARLQTLIAARQWADAARHIQQAQALRPAPPWLAAREADVRLAQVRIALGRDDLSGALTAARLYLNGDEARSQQLLALAREEHAAGDKPAALGLAREVVRRMPAYAAAAAQLAAWEPPVVEARPRAEPKPAPEPKRPIESRPPAPEVDEETALLARLRAAHGQGNVPGTLAAARLFLTGDHARSLKLLEVAREFSARGDRAMAIALTKEVLRRTADFPPAKRLLAELEQAPAK